jgi:very-short-patch-repair endonuclease
MNDKKDLETINRELYEKYLAENRPIKKLKSFKNLSKQTKSTKFKKKIKKKTKKQKYKEFRDKIEENLPKSEIWLRSLYESHNLKKHTDKYNKYINGRYIADLCNHKLKYIIEIDGSIHDTIEQQTKDKIKDDFYFKHHFKVFRIKAFDVNSYIVRIEELYEYINLSEYKGQFELTPEFLKFKLDFYK